MGKVATRDEVMEQAAQWTTEVLLCRIKGHRFTVPITAYHNRRYRFIRTTLGCEGRCGVVQNQEMSEHGHVYSTWLAYPKDDDGNPLYLMPKGMGHVTGEARDELRVQTVFRAFKPTVSSKIEPRSKATKQEVYGDA